MPELPEVETIRTDLESEIVGLKFTDVVFLWPGSLKGISQDRFKKAIIGRKIVAVERRAKNIAIKLDDGHAILMHMKMTGHLLIEKNDLRISPDGKWLDAGGALKDPLNQFIRVIFHLSNGKIMAFSDLRKFGYIKLLTHKELTKVWREYGPEPLTNSFNEKVLTEILANKKQAIKKVLMEQKNVAGIGNIYADEILWEAKIHPLTPAANITPEQIRLLVTISKKILKRAIFLRGTSSSDFRDTRGKKGDFEKELKAYRRTGLPCQRCQSPIKRISVGGRGTHFCPTCQKVKEL